jgi:hypothetical protein
LCAKTSGAASKTCWSSSRCPLKSGVRISTPVPGDAAWIARIVSA